MHINHGIPHVNLPVRDVYCRLSQVETALSSVERNRFGGCLIDCVYVTGRSTHCDFHRIRANGINLVTFGNVALELDLDIDLAFLYRFQPDGDSGRLKAFDLHTLGQIHLYTIARKSNYAVADFMVADENGGH